MNTDKMMWIIKKIGSLLFIVVVMCVGCGSISKKNTSPKPADAFLKEKIGFENSIYMLEIRNYSEYICLDDKRVIDKIIDELDSMNLCLKEEYSKHPQGADMAICIYEEGRENYYKFEIYSDCVTSYGNIYFPDNSNTSVQEFQILLAECISINSEMISDIVLEELNNPEVHREMEQARINLNDYVDLSIESINKKEITYTVEEKRKFDLLDDSELFGEKGYNTMVLDGRYTLEGLYNDEWRDIKSYMKMEGELTVPSGSTYIVSDNTVEITTIWNMVGSLDKGRYRLKKWVNLYNGEEYLEIGKEKYYISIEFDIE